MKKINTLSSTFKQSLDILSVSQMSIIRGGAGTDVSLDLPDAAVGPLEATADDKRRDRPGGGISTH
jgi:hypothetical protein